MRRIVIVGTMGAGKTTVGRALAARLGWRYWDNDTELRRRTGSSAATLAAAHGVDELHRIEAEVLAAGLALAEPAVVAAPGSVALHRPPPFPDPVVWLRASPATLAARVGAGDGRPGLGSLAAVDAARRPGFAALATVTVDVDDRSVAEVVDAILARLDASGPKLSHGSVTVAGCDSRPSS
ncbi:MAG TPA: shikimate kinase [Frankiaceae bacterium]|nr:shikimate kinase [Frankiaceae bacterium]